MTTIFGTGFNNGFGDRLPYNPSETMQGVLNSILPPGGFARTDFSMVTPSITANIAISPMPSSQGKLLLPRELVFTAGHDSPTNTQAAVMSLTTVNEYLLSAYEVAIDRLISIHSSNITEDAELSKLILSMNQTSLENKKVFARFMEMTKSTSNKPLRMLFSRCILEKFVPLGVLLFDSDDNTPRQAAKATGYSGMKTLTISGKVTMFSYFQTSYQVGSRACLILKKERNANAVTQSERLAHCKTLGMDVCSFAFFPVTNPTTSETLYTSRGTQNKGTVIQIGKVLSTDSSPITGDVSSKSISGIKTLSGTGSIYPRLASAFPSAGTEVALHISYF